MIKGFIVFNDKKIPYVVDDYRMELFTEDEIIIRDFCQEHNFKFNYILQGLYFGDICIGKKVKFLVDHSMGLICYLKCFILYRSGEFTEFDTIGFQSPYLDNVFRYDYEYLDLSRAGKNLAVAPLELYHIPFKMSSEQYELVYRIGHDNRLGLLEDHSRKGEILIELKKKHINEYNDISVVLHRFAMFMMSNAMVPYKRIVLYKDGLSTGWFYCPLINKDKTFAESSFLDPRFVEFDVMKFVPKILNNIAQDAGQRISKSIPLGHFASGDLRYSPQRFMEQVMAFEYLFDKLDYPHAEDRYYPLKKELEQMFNEFPEILKGRRLSFSDASEKIKNTRHSIAHGHEYYYEFENNSDFSYLMIVFDKLIQNMSLKWIGFNDTEISEYQNY